jgi:uncharacterized protein YijF (DUF1287 family)
MAERVRKKRYWRNIDYRYIIYIIVFIAILQLLILKIYYKEEPSRLPERLFSPQKDFPISELIPDKTSKELESESIEDTGVQGSDASETEENASNELESLNLTDTQKDIVLKAIALLKEDIEYGMEYFPDTYYPGTDNKWISTDVISVTLNSCGYDIMELIYQDMLEHREAYHMDEVTPRNTPIKYIDSRNVFFQEKFFERNDDSLILTNEYDVEDEKRNFLWQAGDIVYFRFGEDDQYDDLGGFISLNKNENDVPLVIMISGEFKKVSEVDVLLEYEIVGHFRYPKKEVD